MWSYSACAFLDYCICVEIRKRKSLPDCQSFCKVQAIVAQCELLYYTDVFKGELNGVVVKAEGLKRIEKRLSCIFVCHNRELHTVKIIEIVANGRRKSRT